MRWNRLNAIDKEKGNNANITVCVHWVDLILPPPVSRRLIIEEGTTLH